MNKSKTVKNPFASSTIAAANIEDDDSNKDDSTPSPQISSQTKFNYLLNRTNSSRANWRKRDFLKIP